MAQVTDRNIGANPTGFDMRTEINNIIAALESDNSGSSEPLNTVAYMKWVDTSNATYYYVKERNHDNTAWVTLFRYTVATKTMEAVSNGTDLTTILALKAPLASPTFTGPVVLPSTTSIGTITNTELGYLDGVTSSIQTQFTGKQATLVSGTNIKTINSNSILGSGDLIITSSTPQVRQTVLSGAVDTSGFSAFGGSTGSTTVTASSTLVATCAYGSSDRIGTIVNPSWTGLSTNGTMYLYLDIATYGTCTTGSTTLAPTYRWGGADVVTNLQNTFNIQEMKMKVGNGSTASQVYRVFVGEVTVAGGVVTAITWYALMGRYDSGYIATLPNSATSKNHNIGVGDIDSFMLVKCTTADSGYAVDDVIKNPMQNWNESVGRASIQISTTKKTVSVYPNASAPWLSVVKGALSTSTVLTSESWAYKLIVKRGW